MSHQSSTFSALGLVLSIHRSLSFGSKDKLKWVGARKMSHKTKHHLIYYSSTKTVSSTSPFYRLLPGGVPQGGSRSGIGGDLYLSTGSEYSFSNIFSNISH